ncbi:MAG: hypothetical protein VX471_04870 [Acidobacteriota bacterium]|nr:hypothetical protein [Acidobacteriota bacterium]
MTGRHAQLIVLAVLTNAVLSVPVSAQQERTSQDLADLRARADQGDGTLQHFLWRPDWRLSRAMELPGLPSRLPSRNCGVRYMSGRSLRQDCLEAVQWYRGVLKNHAEAHHWLRLARAQRDPVMRYNLIRKAAWRLSMGF